MHKIHRTDIHLVNQYSELPEHVIQKALEENVYNDRANWLQFIRYTLLSLGVGFSVTGIIFFFAYNWDELHKFVKIGLVEVLIVSCMVLFALPKISQPFKSIIITAAAVLVGVLFAVFGQVYQTGANAFDFFLGWTVFIMLWVFVSNFAPLWTIFLLLVNTTFLLYANQVTHDMSEMLILTILFCFNSLALLFTNLFAGKKSPLWFSVLLAVVSAAFGTIGFIMGVFDYHLEYILFFIIISYTAALVYGYRSHSLYYLVIVASSSIIMISALLIRANDDEMMFFGVGIFIVAAVTVLTKYLVQLQKRWNNEN